ncbi:MAG: hypothetical protein WC757_02135 [Candidatus Paceibacterota bacterium]
MDLSSFLSEYSLGDTECKLNELLRGSDTILLYTFDPTVSMYAKLATKDNENAYRYYHHDVRKMYYLWKVQVFKLLKNNPILFEGQSNKFNDLDTVPYDAIAYDSRPDFPCNYGYEWLKNIFIETRQRSKIIREMLKKVKRRLSVGEIEFDKERHLLSKKGKEPILLEDTWFRFYDYMNDKPLKKQIPWSGVYEASTGDDVDSPNTTEDQKRRTVDGYKRKINEKIKEEFDVDDDLFTRINNCFVKNF